MWENNFLRKIILYSVVFLPILLVAYIVVDSSEVELYNSDVQVVKHLDKDLWRDYFGLSPESNKSEPVVSTPPTETTSGDWSIEDPSNLIYYSQGKWLSSQGDGSWPGGNSFTSKKTGYYMKSVANSGCGPTSFAIIRANLENDKSITPAQTVMHWLDKGYYKNSGGSMRYCAYSAAKDFGYQTEVRIHNNKREKEAQIKWMEDHLKAGHFLQCLVGYGSANCGNYGQGGNKVFRNRGHFIVVVGYKEGKTMVYDCGKPSLTRQWFTIEDIWHDTRLEYGAVAIWKE